MYQMNLAKWIALFLLIVTPSGILRAEDISWAGGASTDWHNVLNWYSVTGPPFVWRVPTGSDTATLSDTSSGSVVTLSANTAFINALTLENGFRLDTNGHLLIVDEFSSAETLINGTGSQIIVNPYSDDASQRGFDTDRLNVERGSLAMNAGVADIDVYAYLSSMGTITGHGDVRFFADSTSTALRNHGTIRVFGGVPGDLSKTLTLTAPNSGKLDLDGQFFETREWGVLDVDDSSSLFRGNMTLVIDAPLADAFGGDLQIGQGDTANFVRPWDLEDGFIDFYGASGHATVTGAALTATNAQLTVHSGTAVLDCDASFVNSTIDVNAALQIDGNVALSTTSNLDLNDACDLIVNGELTVNQSVIDLDSNGSMNVIVNSGAVLTLNVDAIDNDMSAEFDRNMNLGGILAANVVGGWIANGDVQLTGGRLTGNVMTNKALLRGHGEVDPSGLINDGTTAAEGGTLVLDSPGDTMDLDGALNSGELHAIAGNLDVREDDVHFGGTLQVAAGRMAEFDGQLYLVDNGMLHLTGGTVRASSVLFFGTDALLVEGAASRIEVANTISFFNDSTINADLTLAPSGSAMERSIWIDDTSRIAGTGRIIATENTALHPFVGASMDIGVRNEGRLYISGISGTDVVGSVKFRSYDQTASGEFQVKIEGDGLGDYDQLIIADNVVLDGLMSVYLRDGFVPDAGDSFRVISAAGELTGSFSGGYRWPLPDRLFWHVDYDYIDDIVKLMVLEALAADFDEDGDVDDADLVLWETGYGISSGADHGDGDANEDGAVNGSDFITWQQQYGESVLPVLAATANAGVPEPASLVLLALSSLMLIRSRRS